ncbi:hypothetical protein [Pediococcus claussenii]|uniref:hypothetical protein n=1 Tax=Pediococcus claussenii TaxID=187452 RepID=UPI00081AAF1B|nr:hypothetical protein [Pediococcus claussenii]ANZ70380.1 hypothetical protein AYR57_08650 [Pediococcus claussenii]ANZ72196.1 hypothetical protein AYR58_08650 [Pediococcus claussenii]
MIVGTVDLPFTNSQKVGQIAQNTADQAATVTVDLNDPNKLTPSEKTQLAARLVQYQDDCTAYATQSGDSSQIVLALDNLKVYLAPFLSDMTTTDVIDRSNLNSLLNAWTKSVINFDTAKKAQYDTDMGSAAVALSQAQLDIGSAKQQASSAYDSATSAINSAAFSSSVANNALTIASQAKIQAVATSSAVVNISSKADSIGITAQSNSTNITSINLRASGWDSSIQTANGNINALQATANGLQGSIQTANGNITNLQATATGLQTQITNNLSNLSTQVTQTNTAWQAAVGNIGQNNLVYNSEFINSLDGWAGSPAYYYTSTAWNSTIGPGGLALNISDTTDAWYSKLSKRYPVGNILGGSVSASVQIQLDAANIAPSAGFTIEFFNDLTSGRTSYQGVTADRTITNQLQLVTLSNVPIPAGAQYVCLTLRQNKNGHTLFQHPMMVLASTVGAYQKDTANLSTISLLQNDINLRVKQNDVVNQINIDGSGILIDGKKVHITGTTTIDNGVIQSASIGDLVGKKITGGEIIGSNIHSPDNSFLLNGATGVIQGATMVTPQLNLGMNGTLTEQYSLSESTGFFAPRKATGTTTLDSGVLMSKGTLQTYNNDKGYWYGYDDNYNMVNGGSNLAADSYSAGYEKHDIFKSDGKTVLLRSNFSAESLTFYAGGNVTRVSTLLSANGLYTGTITGTGLITTPNLINADLGGYFGNNIVVGGGKSPHTINSTDGQGLYFNAGVGSGGAFVPLNALAFNVKSSLSAKKDIRELKPSEALNTVINSDVMLYRYNEEDNSVPLKASVIIDDVNNKPMYRTPDVFKGNDRSFRDDGTIVGYLMQAVKELNTKIEGLEVQLNG